MFIKMPQAGLEPAVVFPARNLSPAHIPFCYRGKLVLPESLEPSLNRV